jgi:hypothetical protein
MKPFGHQLLAGPALADHQHRSVERGGAAGALDRVEERSRLTNEMGFAFHAKRLADFPICWQVLFAEIDALPGHSLQFSAIF